MSQHKITALRTGTYNGMDWDAEYEITFDYVQGSPDYWNHTRGHWEQGWSAEVDATDVRPLIGSFDDAREKAEALDWAREWIQDEGYSAALEEVASDMEAAREFAAELRADR